MRETVSEIVRVSGRFETRACQNRAALAKGFGNGEVTAILTIYQIIDNQLGSDLHRPHLPHLQGSFPSYQSSDFCNDGRGRSLAFHLLANSLIRPSRIVSARALAFTAGSGRNLLPFHRSKTRANASASYPPLTRYSSPSRSACNSKSAARGAKSANNNGNAPLDREHNPHLPPT